MNGQCFYRCYLFDGHGLKMENENFMAQSFKH